MKKFNIDAAKKLFESKWKLNEETGCHEWTRGKTKSGYGVFAINRVFCRAHRVSWTFYRGEIPNGLCVLHKCDNRACVNPEHLFLGTNQDNSSDMVSKQRSVRGELVANSKLTDSNVRDIRKLRESGLSYRAISKQFGVTARVIVLVITRRTWQHVK